MPRDYYPRPEADIVGWTANLRSKIEVDPQQFGLTRQQSEDYAQAQQRFADLYRAAISPSERTPVVMIAKNTARIELEGRTRKLVNIILAQPTTTMQTRATLGLALRGRGGYRRAMSPPDRAPRLMVRSINGRIATINLIDREGGKRRKPRGAGGMMLWSFVGEMPPAKFAEWKYTGQSNRTINRIAFDEELNPGTKVWLTACWVSPVGQRGRLCNPVSTHVGASGPMSRASIKSARMLYVSSVPSVPVAKAELKLAV